MKSFIFTNLRCSDDLPAGCERCDDICAKKDGKRGKDDYKIDVPESKLTNILNNIHFPSE